MLATIPPIEERRLQHLAVYLENYTLQCISVTRTNRGHIGGGKHEGFVCRYRKKTILRGVARDLYA